MPRITAFKLSDCTLDFGTYCLGGDFDLYLEGDGYDFELTHAFSCDKRMDEAGVALVKHWIEGDLVSKDSRVRREWRTAVDEAEDDAPAARADYENEMRGAA